MDFNGPGVSIFQETALDAFDSNAQREEEKEALEEQRRRDIEVNTGCHLKYMRKVCCRRYIYTSNPNETLLYLFSYVF